MQSFNERIREYRGERMGEERKREESRRIVGRKLRELNDRDDSAVRRKEHEAR